MKLKLITFFLVLAEIILAQNFIEVVGTPFDGVQTSSCAFSDVDGDGDSDLLITGLNNSDEKITKLYTNDGGSFSEVLDTPFDGVETGSIAFSDVDGDGDYDLLVTGVNNSSEIIAKLYLNDEGSFTEVQDTPFDGVEFGSVAFADVDGDGDNDLMITGRNAAFERIGKLYTNDGGSFTEVMNTPFDGVASGSIAFADVDEDGDNDLMITGLKTSGEKIAKLYANNGSSFTQVMDTPFEGVTASSIAFSDVDGDGDEDLLISGLKDIVEETQITTLYRNDGGVFTETADTPFSNVDFASIGFSDTDNDGDEDVLITGRMGSNELIAKLYTNDGGNFIEVMDMPFEGVGAGSIAFSDVDSDGNKDVLITGFSNSGEGIAKLYKNDGMVSSTDDIEPDISLDFKLFPNPSKSSYINVSYNSLETGEIMIKVYNLNGSLISQQKEFVEIGKQTLSIDIGLVKRGSYLIALNNGNRREMAKFIVE